MTPLNTGHLYLASELWSMECNSFQGPVVGREPAAVEIEPHGDEQQNFLFIREPRGQKSLA